MYTDIDSMSTLAEDKLNSNVMPMACALQSPSPMYSGRSLSEILASPVKTPTVNQNLSVTTPDTTVSHLPTSLICPRCGGQVRAAYLDAWNKAPVWADSHSTCQKPTLLQPGQAATTKSPRPSQTIHNTGPLSPGKTHTNFLSDSSSTAPTTTDHDGASDRPETLVRQDSVIICTFCDAVVPNDQINPLLPRDDNSPLVPAASYNLNTLNNQEEYTRTNFLPFQPASTSPALSISLAPDSSPKDDDQRSPSFYCSPPKVTDPEFTDISQAWKGATLKLDTYLVKIDDEHDYYKQLYRGISSPKEIHDDHPVMIPPTVNQSNPPQGQCYSPEELVHLPTETGVSSGDAFLSPGGHMSRHNSSVRLRTSRFDTSPEMVNRLSSRPGMDALEGLRQQVAPSPRPASAQSNRVSPLSKESPKPSSDRNSSTTSTKQRSKKSQGDENRSKSESKKHRRGAGRSKEAQSCPECNAHGPRELCAEHYPNLPPELMHELHDLDHENDDLSADVVYALQSRNFMIKELLGKGISSTVRRVTEKNTGIEFAVKIIDISGEKGEGALVEQTKKDTYREIRILRMCGGHENIIELHDVFETPTFIFLVFEICKKGELFDYLTSVVSLSEKRTRIFMRQLFEAVAFLHEKNIVHRDLKPENILLDDNLNIKVSDFGFATVLEPGEELVELCGTPGYLAPEVLAHSMYENVSGYGREVDMWACGVIMYTLLCGAPPFWNRRQMMMLRAIMNADYTFNSPEWDDISDSPKNLIEKLLVVNPQQRLSAKEALNHPFFHSQASEMKKFNPRQKFRTGVFCVMFYLRLNFFYKHPPPISMDTVRTNPYGIKMMRKIIDGCAFGMYKHWVKRVDNQNRAALFEHTLRDDWKHNILELDHSSSIRA